MGAKRKRILGVLAVLLLLLAIAAVTAQYWWIHALGPLARAQGIRYDRVEQLENGRLAFHGLKGKKVQVTFSAEYLETPTVRQLWRARNEGFPPDAANETILIARNWVVNISREGSGAPAPLGEKPAPSADRALDGFKEAIQDLHRRLPSAELSNGKLILDGQDFVLGHVRWNNNQLATDVTWPGLISPAQLEATLPPDGPYSASFRILPLQVSLRATIEEQQGQWWLSSTNLYYGNRFRIQARFGDEGLLPLEGSLTGKSIKLPGRVFGLESFAEVTGDIDLRLEQEAYNVSAQCALHRNESDPFSSIASEFGDADEAPAAAVTLTAQGARDASGPKPARVTSGEMRFPEATLPITQGAITPRVAMSFFPTIDLRAQTNVADRQITVRIVGPANRPDVQYQSAPELPPPAIQRLLTEGATGDVNLGAASNH